MIDRYTLSKINEQFVNQSKLFFLYRGIIICLFLYYSFLMVIITLQYVPIDFAAAFLATKQHVIHLKHYQIAFFSHVYSSIFILVFGATQFIDKFRVLYPSIHRLLGTIYVVCILIISAPSGLIMGIYGYGGIVSQISFVVLSILWFYLTLQAFVFIKRRMILKHKQYMILSYSLTLSAITLRLSKQLLSMFTEIHRYEIYQISSWIGWVVNLLIACIIVRKIERRYSITQKAH